MLKQILNIFLKSNCCLCQRPADTGILCQDCSRQLKSYRGQNPQQFWQGDLPLFVWGRYEGKLKQAIAALKYNRQPQLGELMGMWLGETWLQAPPVAKRQKLVVIPIPLHPRKLKERGFNQAEAIARGFCQITGYDLNQQGLLRCKDTAPLYSLSPAERRKNLAEAFQVSLPLKAKLPPDPILLLDDIYTTGATAGEAAKILRAEGIKVLGVAVTSNPRFCQESSKA